MMTPGTYLQKRRQVAGVTLHEAALILGTPAHSTRPPAPRIRRALRRRLQQVEASADFLCNREAGLLRSAFPFAVDIYQQLVDLHLAPDDIDLPRPVVCRSCACSWFDPCLDPDGRKAPCAWTADPELCTACASALAIAQGEDPPAAPSPGAQA